MSTSPPQRIGIAVVEYNGRFLIGTRGPESPLPGYAEFPGGKCASDETADACAVRECLEETYLAVTVERLLFRREYAYPHATVDLHFFLCHPAVVESVHDEHNGFRWIPADQLKALKLPEANAPVVDLLITG